MTTHADTQLIDSDTESFPIRLEPRDAFDTVRSLFQRAGYLERAVAERLGGRGRLAGVKRIREGRTTLTGPVEDANAALVRLFIDGEPLETALVMSLLGSAEVEALRRLGLLAPDGDANLAATVVVAPIRGLWLASDRIPGPNDDWQVGQDFVYSAINELTGEFLDAIPPMPGARVLELCAGSGVGALCALAAGAAFAMATDLTPRSVHFARFNAALNGQSDRFVALQSDVWDAVGDETFDLVVAHPPYVPAFSHVYDFRDAGVDGESVTRRIVEGLPAHLRPGGRAVVRAAVSDRKAMPVVARIRGWLAESSPGFDVVQLVRQEFTPLDYYRSITRGAQEFVDLERWMRHFAALEIERFMLCIVDIRRVATGRAPLSDRRTFGPQISPEIADWLLAWGRFRLSHGDGVDGRLARLASAHPRVCVGVRLAVHLEHAADGWHTVGGNVEAAWPVHTLIKAPPFMPTFLELCDGSRDIGDLLSALRAGGLVDGAVGVGEVSLMVETLAAAGIVELAECPLPPRPAD